MIDHNWESVLADMEMPEGNTSISDERLMKEYQLKIEDASREGNMEERLFYALKMDRLRSAMTDSAAPAEELGSEPYPELKRASITLQQYKRDLSSLEHQRRPGKEDPELERKITKAKRKVDEQKREYERLQQYEKFRLMPYGEITQVRENTTVAGNPEKDAENWHKQGEKYSCAVVCQEFVAEQLLNHDFSERELIEYATKHGWYDPETGTTPMDVGKILESLGLHVERTNGKTLNDLINRLNSGTKIICAVNNMILARPEFSSIPGQQANHAVEVIGVKRTDSDTWIILNDPGVENGKNLHVKASTFMKAWETGNNFTVFVSKKGA